MSLSVVLLLCVLPRLIAVSAQAASDQDGKRSSICWSNGSKQKYTDNATDAGPNFDGLEDFTRWFYGEQVRTQQIMERSLRVTETFLNLLNSAGDFDGDAEEVKRDFLRTLDVLLPIKWPSCPAPSPLHLSIVKCLTKDMADFFGSAQDTDPEIEKMSSTEDALAQKQEPEIDKESLSFENQTRAFEADFRSEAGSETDTHASSDEGAPKATSPFEVDEGDNKDVDESASATENWSCTGKSAADDPTEHWKRPSHSDVDTRSEGRCSRRDTENAPTSESANEKSQTSEEWSGNIDEYLNETNRLLVESMAREDKSKTTAGDKGEPEDFKLFEDLTNEMKNAPDFSEKPDRESGSQKQRINRHGRDLAGGIIPQVTKSQEGKMHCPAVDGNNFWQPGPHAPGRCPLQVEATRSTREKLEEHPVTGDREASGFLDTHFSDGVSSLKDVSNRSDSIDIEAANMSFGSNLEYFIFDGVFWKKHLSEKARKSAEQSSDQSENQEASEEQSTDLPDASTTRTLTTDGDFLLENEVEDTEAIKNPADVQDQEEVEYFDEEVRERKELLETIRRIKQGVDKSDVTQALGGGKGTFLQHASIYDILYEISPTTKPDNDDQRFQTPNPMWEYRQDVPPPDEEKYKQDVPPADGEEYKQDIPPPDDEEYKQDVPPADGKEYKQDVPPADGKEYKQDVPTPDDEEYKPDVPLPDEEEDQHKVSSPTTLPPPALVDDCSLPDVQPPPHEAPDRVEL